VRIGETTAIQTLKYFIRNINKLYGMEYLQSPNHDELKIILSCKNEARGFPGCLGSIDGTHWAWKNCPLGWAGHFKGKEKKSNNHSRGRGKQEPLYLAHLLWHSGALNNINVLHQSHLFDKLLSGASNSIEYSINGHNYKTGYYLCNRIYPPWFTLVALIKHLQDGASKHFSMLQEATCEPGSLW
jgi:hypothetical protein